MPAVGYDSRAVTIGGRRTLLLTGSIHYPRSTPGMWPDLMKRSKDAGLNTIDTYVFWNLHERERGVYDFSGRLDLPRFCDLAAEHGLNLVLRIGPYVCAETNYGGLPAWLRDVPGMQMRTDNVPFMQEMERWVRLVTHILKDRFSSGPIILAQLENEFSNISMTYGEAGKRYLQWVADLGHSLDVGVPWVMCMGSAPGVIETINEAYPHRKIASHFADHPTQPAYCTELYPGWYDVWGGIHVSRSAADCAYAVARFIAEGGAGVTYYMWHGGTNFGRETMYLQTTQYDFGAPLDEYGMQTEKSEHLGRLHRLLLENNDTILGVDKPEVIGLGEKLFAFTYPAERGGLTFLCNDTGRTASVNFRGVCYEVAPSSVIVLEGSAVLMDTARVEPEDRIVRSWRAIDNALSPPEIWTEPTPFFWPAGIGSPVRSDQPLEQLLLTADKTDYCWYSAEAVLDCSDEGVGVLTLDRTADAAHVYIDGVLAATTPTPLQEDRGRTDSDSYRQQFTLEVQPGLHRIDILCCSLGLIKGDWMLGFQNMVEERKGIWGPVRWNGEIIAGPWIMQPGLCGEQIRIFEAGQALVNWTFNPDPPAGLHWIRFRFERPTGSGPAAIDLSGMTKGMAWLNGHCIGRFWQTPCEAPRGEWLADWVDSASVGQPIQRYYHLPADWLLDHNTLIILEELRGDAASIRLCRVEYSRAA